MSKNLIIVNAVYSNDAADQYTCKTSINNFSIISERIDVGESITSNIFEMIFPNSIGESKWKLMFYPNGQYINGRVGNGIGIYLLMVSCEGAEKTLRAKVTFRLESENDHNGYVKNSDTEFDYSIPSKRWIGAPEFFTKNWLNAKRRKMYCSGDSLLISCSVEELEAIEMPIKLEEEKVTKLENETKRNCLRSREGSPEDNKDFDWLHVTQTKGKKMKISRSDPSPSEPKSSVF